MSTMFTKVKYRTVQRPTGLDRHRCKVVELKAPITIHEWEWKSQYGTLTIADMFDHNDNGGIFLDDRLLLHNKGGDLTSAGESLWDENYTLDFQLVRRI